MSLIDKEQKLNLTHEELTNIAIHADKGCIYCMNILGMVTIDSEGQYIWLVDLANSKYNPEITKHLHQIVIREPTEGIEQEEMGGIRIGLDGTTSGPFKEKEVEYKTYKIRYNQDTHFFDVFDATVPDFPELWSKDNPPQKILDSYKIGEDFDTINDAKKWIDKTKPEENGPCLACKNGYHEDCYVGGNFITTGKHVGCDCEQCYGKVEELSEYENGYAKGWDEGEERGYADGYIKGLAERGKYHMEEDNDFARGYNDGYRDGYDTGLPDGVTSGKHGRGIMHVEEGLKFCKHCGSTLTTAEEIHWNICKECGKDLAEGRKPGSWKQKTEEDFNNNIMRVIESLGLKGDTGVRTKGVYFDGNIGSNWTSLWFKNVGGGWVEIEGDVVFGVAHENYPSDEIEKEYEKKGLAVTEVHPHPDAPTPQTHVHVSKRVPITEIPTVLNSISEVGSKYPMSLDISPTFPPNEDKKPLFFGEEKEKNTIFEINVIPKEQQRYDTVGDWIPGNPVKINISKLDNPDYEFLTALHELIEYKLCEKRGITDEEVVAFDTSTKSNKEPGSLPDAPYKKEHEFANKMEKMMCEEMGIDWKEYDEHVGRKEEEKKA